MNNDYTGIMLFILIIACALLYIIPKSIKKSKPKKIKEHIIYQDNQKHRLHYRKIPVYQDVPFHDFQYVYYLLSLIGKLPADQFVMIYCLLVKWQNDQHIKLEKENDHLSIYFYHHHIDHQIENDLYQMLYAISENHTLDFYTLKIWFQTDYQSITQWIKDFLQDEEYQLRKNGILLNGKYHLKVYDDLVKLIGYKKYLNMYNDHINNEETYLYALLFELDVEKLNLYIPFYMNNYNPTFRVR